MTGPSNELIRAVLKDSAPGSIGTVLSGSAAAGVYMNTVSAFIRGKRRARLAVSLMLVIAVCAACDSGTPTRPSQAFSPSPAPSPSPSPPPAVAHQVEIAWEPDLETFTTQLAIKFYDA